MLRVFVFLFAICLYGQETPVLQSVLAQDLQIHVATGTPAEMGAALGKAQEKKIGMLLMLFRLRAHSNPKPRTALIRPHHREEILAQAQAAGVSADSLLTAHLITEPQCSAVIVPPADNRPLRIGRNMDFAPEGILGQATCIHVWRAPGLHAVASVGFPGLSGVVSGMNDAGVTACILLNKQQEDPLKTPGEPIILRIRACLENAADLAGAITVFQASAPGSGHYVVFADAKNAALCWWTPTGMRKIDMKQDAILSVDNQPRDENGLGIGPRAKTLLEHVQLTSTVEEIQSSLTSVYLKKLNAQAMVFEPENRSLLLARGSTMKAACLNPWVSVQLRGVLEGKAPLASEVLSLPAVKPLQHYTDRKK